MDYVLILFNKSLFIICSHFVISPDRIQSVMYYGIEFYTPPPHLCVKNVCPPGDKQIVCPPGDKQNVTDGLTHIALYIYRYNILLVLPLRFIATLVCPPVWPMMAKHVKTVRSYE